MVKTFLALVLSCLMLWGPETLYAANYQWIQSDWSGGADLLNTTGHDPAQNGQTLWNRYYSKDPNADPFSRPGELSLSFISSAWLDTQFNTGKRKNLTIDNTTGFLSITPYGIDLGTGADGDLVVDGTTVQIDGTRNYKSVTVRNGGVLTASPASVLSPTTSVHPVAVSNPGGTNPTGQFFYVVTVLDRLGNETPRSPLSEDGNNDYFNTDVQKAPSISWSPVTEAAGYRVYRRNYSPTDYASPALVCTITLPDTACSATSCSCMDTHPTPDPGAPHLKTLPSAPTATVSPTGGRLSDGTYYYAVTAIDFWGFETTPGTERVVQVCGENSTPSNCVQTSIASVALTWSGMGEAAGYRLYRTGTPGIYNNPSLVCETSSTGCTDTLDVPMPGAPPRSYDNAIVNGELRIKVQGAFSVDQTSMMTLDGRGFPGGVDTSFSLQGLPGKGPGAGGNRGGGGGYGSAGTANNNAGFPSAVGSPYGDFILNPLYPGSGGAGGSFIVNSTFRGGQGGAGGGALRISADTLSVSGKLTANGSPGQNVTQTNTDPGGGGSGGTIFMDGNSVTLNGTAQITAGGGTGGKRTSGTLYNYAQGGSGGNGRIRISAGSLSGSGLTNITTPPPFVGNLGSYESPSWDLGAGGAKFSSQVFSWIATLNGGNLKFLLATNQDNKTWVFRGHDGTPEGSANFDNSKYYTTPGTQIWAGHDGDRYVKYKVLFEAPDINTSPVLQQVSVGYAYNPSLQTLVSSPYDTGDATNILRRLQWGEQQPPVPGTGIRFQIRTAGNSTDLLSLSNWYGPFQTALGTSGVPVQDPDFESCVTQYTVPPGWTASSMTTSSGCISKATYPGGVHGGNWSAATLGSRYFYQPISLRAGVTYTFNVWARVEIASLTATLLISDSPGGGTPYGNCNPSASSLTFTQLTCQYTPPADQTVYVSLKAGSAGFSRALFDDLTISVPGTAGLDTITVTDVSGFVVGDGVTLTDLNNRDLWEFKQITAIDPVNRRVTLDSPLTSNYINGSVLTNAYSDPQGTQTINIAQRDGTNDRWLQYRVLLTTSDKTRAPYLLEDRLGYLPASGVYQPDGVIDGNGNGIYGAAGSGSGGASGRSTDPGFRGGLASYALQVQNDGNAASGLDTETLTWNTPSDASGSWSVVLNDGTQDLTSPVTLNLNPGESRDYTLKVVPSAYAPADLTQTVILNIHSENEYNKADSIRAVTTVNRAYQADGVIGGNGDNLYDATGAGNGGAASNAASPAAPGDTVIFPLTLQNDGNIQDAYILSQTTACLDGNNIVRSLPPNWKVLVNDGTTDHNITTASWTTPIFPAKIDAGSEVQYTLKILSLGEPVTCDTVLKIDSHDLARTLDSVKATTVLAPTYGVDLTIESRGDKVFGNPNSGKDGEAAKGIPGGTTGSFNIGVQNEGNVPDYYELSWATPAGWITELLHQDGTSLLKVDNSTGVSSVISTSLVPLSDTSCPYFTFTDTNGNNQFDPGIDRVDQCLAIAGEVIPLKLQVKPPPTFTSGDQPILIDGKSMGNPNKVDSVRARVWANALNAPDITVVDTVDFPITSTSIPLTWTTLSWPTGINLYYDLRFFTKRIIEDGILPGAGEINFSNATAARGLPIPQSAGNTEKFTVKQLYAGTTYYFALKVKTSSDLTSVMSNCTNCPAVTLPSADATPPSTVTDLAVTASTADAVTLCWSAPFDDTSGNPVTGYLLKYSTRSLIDDSGAPGMGEIRFSDAATADGLGTPKPPGSKECYRVNVKNIVSGNDRTPNSQFFFSLKSEDENHNLSPMSNPAKGVTAMSSMVYNMVSVPKVPNPNTPADVFGDDVGSPLYLYWWDSRGVGHERGCYDGLPNPYNPNNEVPACTQITSIQEGKGYFLWSPRLDIALDAPVGSTDAAPTTCTGEAGQSFPCYVFPLQEGWNMVGNPFGKEVDVSAIKVRRMFQPPVDNPLIVTMTFQGAVAAGWIGTGGIYTYNGTHYTYDVCDAVVCNPVLQPWKGYWVWLGTSAVNTTYDLLIPSP